MKFREHRGGLKESMETEKEIMTPLELQAYLGTLYTKPIEEMKFEYVGFDVRVGWDTSYVLVRFKGEQQFVVVGMVEV